MDIRKFFASKPAVVKSEPKQDAAPPGAPAAATAPPAAVAVKQEQQQRPVKRSKYFEGADDGDEDDDEFAPSKKAATADAKNKAAAAAPSAAAPAVPASAKAKAAAKTPPKQKSSSAAPAPKKKRQVIIDSDVEEPESDDDDDDDDDVIEDSDDIISDDDDFSADDSDDDGGGKKSGGKQKKRARPSSTSKGPKQKATPPAKAAAAASRALPTSNVVTTNQKQPATSPRGSGGTKAVKSSPASAGGAKKAVYKAPELDSTAKAAMAAVDAAAKQLPPEAEIKFTELAEGVDAPQGNEAAEPPLRGTRDVPRGHPDCLTGKTFVITGVLKYLFRHEAEDLIKRHGGRVTQAVSGKTDFLLAGDSCGRSKLRAAREKKTKIIDEECLFRLISATQHLLPKEDEEGATGPSGAAAAAPSGAASAGRAPPLSTQPFMGGRPSAPLSTSAAAAAAAAAAAGRGGASTSGSGSGSGSMVTQQLWVDKHKPGRSGELVGNNTAIDTLRKWLASWEAVHLRGAEAPSGGTGAKPKDMTKKAVLISGPPGIGKTTSSHIVAREAGFHVVEVNASDTRSKADKASAGVGGKVANVVKEMATNTCISAGDGVSRKQLLIMDEVDGMSGGDRGGIQDLIQTIQKSKIPIICICNDKYSQKLRSLRNHCLELDFRRPTTQQVSKRMLEIAQREGLALNQATMDALVEGANGDIRLVLGQLQMVRVRSRALSYDDVKGKLGTSKDFDMSPFECARRLMEPGCALLSLGDRVDMVFQDMDLVPLLIQENYVNHRPAIAANDSTRMRALAKAADSISAGDTVNGSLRRYNNWSLAPAACVIGSVMPAAYMRGGRETFGLYPGEANFPRFTAWLGNYSTSNKQKRLLSELTTALAASGHAAVNRSSVRLEYLSAMRTLLTKPLARDQEEGIPTVIELMQTYCIDREHFDAVLDLTSFKSKGSWAIDPMKDVETKTKSAFTRTFNKQGFTPKTGAQMEEVKVGRGKGKKKAAAAAAGGGEGDETLGEGDNIDGEPMAGKPARTSGDGSGQGAAAGGGAEEEEEEEELADTSALERKLSRRGVEFVPKGGPSSGKGASGKASGGRGGRGGGGARGGGRGSGASTSGRSRGSGGGRGKK